jgi:y4mF family transcriptional regulator
MYVRRPHDLGALIRDRRKAKGLTQAALGRQLGVRQEWVSNLEKGKFGSRLDLVLAALDALGVSLWADIGEGAPPPGSAKARSSKIDMASLVDQMLNEL